jgi:hypothetical protein
MSQELYDKIFNDISMLSEFNKTRTKQRIIDKHKLIILNLTNKISTIEYFNKCAEEQKFIYENDANHWTSYFAGRRYNEYLLLIEILNEVN